MPRDPYEYHHPMPAQIEAAIKQIMGAQQSAAILRISEYPALAALTPFVDYAGQEFTATRKRVDQLDQATISRRPAPMEKGIHNA